MDQVEFGVAWRNFGWWPLLFCITQARESLVEVGAGPSKVLLWCLEGPREGRGTTSHQRTRRRALSEEMRQIETMQEQKSAEVFSAQSLALSAWGFSYLRLSSEMIDQG